MKLDKKQRNTFISKIQKSCGNNKKFSHNVKVLTPEQVEHNRSSAYKYLILN